MFCYVFLCFRSGDGRTDGRWPEGRREQPVHAPEAAVDFCHELAEDEGDLNTALLDKYWLLEGNRADRFKNFDF